MIRYTLLLGSRARTLIAMLGVVCAHAGAQVEPGPTSLTDHAAGAMRAHTPVRAIHHNAPPAAWSQFAGGPARVSSLDRTIDALGEPAWVVHETDAGEPVYFLPSAGVVTTPDLVLAVGVVGLDDALIAVDRRTGEFEWATAVPIAVNDSWSTPAVDLSNDVAIVASGASLTAITLSTGSIEWTAALSGVVLNASPVVTGDRGAADRAFVTDFSVAGAGRLYAINIDPFDAGANPFAPGEIVWIATLPGAASGATPAYADGRVYVATVNGSAAGGGTIAAYDASATSAPAPAWVYEHPSQDGFFGGVSIRAGSVYACTYDFGSGRFNSELVRVRAHDGGLVWRTPCERTDTTPAVLADGRVVVSAGAAPDAFFGDFGSRPSVLVYDHTGSLLWDSASATWDDSDADGSIDAGEYLPLGGWTSQPVVIDNPAGARPAIALVTQSAPVTDGVFFDGVEGLALLDLDAAIMGLPFVIDTTGDGGWSPAANAGWVYSAGPGGLSAWRRDVP